MPVDPNSPAGNPSSLPSAADRAKEIREKEHAGPAPSKPLQIFLLVALVMSGAAYVVDQWTASTMEDAQAKRPNKFRRLVENQSQFLTNTDLGRQAEAKKRYDEAIIDYRRALLGENSAEGHLNLGNALLKQGNPDMAFSQFTEAVRLNPHLEAVYIAWGQALKLEGKTDEVVHLYQDALRHDSNFAQVHYNFALVLEQQRQRAQAGEAQVDGTDAVKHYAAAARLGLNTADFWRNYGNMLSQLGKFPEAEACLTKAVELQPGLGAAQFQLGVALDHQGKYAEAIGHYEAALAAVPDDPATLDKLALLYATATNQEVRSPKMAVLLATRACDATTDQNARYMDTLARAYAADGDFFQATAWEDKAVRRATQLNNQGLLLELEPHFRMFVQHKAE